MVPPGAVRDDPINLNAVLLLLNQGLRFAPQEPINRTLAPTSRAELRKREL